MVKRPTSAPTLRMIAEAAGVSIGTVSLALRDKPQTSRTTRAKVKAIAAKLGYRPDPRIAKLMSYLQQRKRKAAGGTLAFVSAFAERDVWRESVTWTNYFEGAVAKADELGYTLEHFWARAPGVSAQRLSQILHSRGIEGLLIAPVPTTLPPLALDWDRFSSVAFGYSLKAPRLHRVVHHHFHTISMAVAALRARGYERIGLVIGPDHDERVTNLWSAGFLTFKGVIDPAHAVGLYRGPLEAAPLLKWFRRHRPDAVISDELAAVDIFNAAGLRVPHDYAFATLDWQQRTQPFAGIDQHSHDVGAAAVKHVIGSLQRDEHGVPDRPETLMIEGSWVEGASVPPRKGAPVTTAPLTPTWRDRSVWR